MADLVLDHLIFRIEIVADVFEKLLRYFGLAEQFPEDDIPWAVKYRNHLMVRFFKYFGRKWLYLYPASHDEAQTSIKDVPITASSVPIKSCQSKDGPITASSASIKCHRSKVIPITVSSAPIKRRRSEGVDLITVSFAPLKRVCVQGIIPADPDVFEDAVESQH